MGDPVQWVLDTLREREAVCRACGGSGHRNGRLRAADPFGTCPGCGGTGNVAAADREAPMPESVSAVDAILDGLREQATRPDDRSITRFDPFVSLADAEAAVHAAYEAGREADAPDAVKEIYAEYEREATRAVRLERERDAAADARTQEIVEEIRDGITMIADNEFEEGANAALESALGLIARRFPNGGTHK